MHVGLNAAPRKAHVFSVQAWIVSCNVQHPCENKLVDCKAVVFFALNHGNARFSSERSQGLETRRKRLGRRTCEVREPSAPRALALFFSCALLLRVLREKAIVLQSVKLAFF